MKSYLKTKDYFLSQEEFELFLDEDYQMLVTKPQPEKLEKYYQSKSYISHSDGKEGFIEKIYQKVKRYNLSKKISLLNKYADKKSELLDIGAGTGDFLLQAKNDNWNVSGVEPNNKARSRAEEKGIDLFERLEEVKEKQYDAISLWHVLEHLPNIKPQFKEIVSLMKESGVLVIAVPNYNAYDAKHYSKFWAGYDVPRHLYHFSQNTIKKLAKDNELKLVAIRPMWFDAFYVSLLSEKYKNGKSNFFKAFFIGAVSNFKAIFTKECSSLIYVLRKTAN